MSNDDNVFGIGHHHNANAWQSLAHANVLNGFILAIDLVGIHCSHLEGEMKGCPIGGVRREAESMSDVRATLSEIKRQLLEGRDVYIADAKRAGRQ